jgi:dihydroneopterin triphosphate diphosphatase
MARAPFQVIVLPYVMPASGEPSYAVLRRRKLPTMWQAVSGGGEDEESISEAAARELFEESGIRNVLRWLPLDARAAVPACAFSGVAHWPANVLVVPEHAFGAQVASTELQLSDEQSEVAWLPFIEAHQRLVWDSNRVALWELHCRIMQLRPSQLADPAMAKHLAAAIREGAVTSRSE